MSSCCIAALDSTDSPSSSPPSFSTRTASPTGRILPLSYRVTAAIRVVLTNGHTGHVPRAPGFFFFFEEPPTGCGEINFLKLIILLPLQRSAVRETR